MRSILDELLLFVSVEIDRRFTPGQKKILVGLLILAPLIWLDARSERPLVERSCADWRMSRVPSFWGRKGMNVKKSNEARLPVGKTFLDRAGRTRTIIDWQRVTLNLRTHYKPLAAVAPEVGSDWRVLNRLARGESLEPKFSVGLRLLDLHHTHCGSAHRSIVLTTTNEGM